MLFVDKKVNFNKYETESGMEYPLHAFTDALRIIEESRIKIKLL